MGDLTVEEKKPWSHEALPARCRQGAASGSKLAYRHICRGESSQLVATAESFPSGKREAIFALRELFNPSQRWTVSSSRDENESNSLCSLAARLSFHPPPPRAVSLPSFPSSEKAQSNFQRSRLKLLSWGFNEARFSAAKHTAEATLCGSTPLASTDHLSWALLQARHLGAELCPQEASV